MTDLSAGLRKKLAESFAIFSSRVARRQTSRDGTEKLLLELFDGEKVECVLMRDDDRRTICISTQVGCGMGCVFCASGLLGLSRNLSTGEIVEQILQVDRLLPPLERITNVVVMGMGEPLANLANLLKALATLDEKGDWAWGPGGSRFRRWASPKNARAGPGRQAVQPGRVAPRAERPFARRSSCRSIRTSESQAVLMPPTSSSSRPGGG